ncbi:hypothetical protein DPMN_147044 [Dreissena polymorpha]|uniref:Uncharacterized protein n=1 Tax=Dreissena polymorpha TaxID=45954 RepID=A0A9D4FBG2_DREPO|nr:hypothetical protein DPMN_147044 [Dreissena polymorpha]
MHQCHQVQTLLVKLHLAWPLRPALLWTQTLNALEQLTAPNASARRVTRLEAMENAPQACS